MRHDSTHRRDVLKGIGASAVGGLGLLATDSAAAQESPSVTLLHDTHVHGRYANAFAGSLNVANYFGVMNDIEEVGVGSASRGNVLRVGNGDDLASSVLSAVFQGRHITSAFNAGGLDYDTFGNHDFDMGPEVLRERIGDSRFTWVSANVREGDEVFGADQGARLYGTTDVDGVTLGVTGLITPEAPVITSIGEETEVLEPAAAMEEVVPMMREDGADAVVVLSHLSSPVAERVAREVDGIDAIVGDHAAQVLEEPRVVDDTVLSFVGDQYEYVGELTLDLDADAGVTGHEFTLHPVGESSADPDPWVGFIRRYYQSQLSDRLDVVIGETTVPLDVRESVVRRRESNFANYIADAMRESAGSDITLTNGGGIRTDTLYFEDASESSPADISRRVVVDVLPFPNNVVELEVTGETLMAALENGVSRVENRAGRFPQVSGMAFTYDPDAAVGERIVEATVGGEPVDASATYTMATNDFVSGGGDGYSMLADAEVLLPSNEGALLSDLVARNIEADGTIAPETEGRVTRQ